MFEQIIITGHLGGDPEMRFTPGGRPVTSFSVAANARWTNADGTPGERVTWYRVTCWGRLAEVTNRYLAKGRRVMVIASRIEAEAYLDREGQPRASLKVTADAVKFLDSAADLEPDEEVEEVAF
jgi:single-strand DNA-binding protein